jgi:hypothetical protein
MSVTLKVVGAAFFVFAIALGALSVPLYWGQIKILRTWPAAEAEVVRSEVITAPLKSGGQLYDALYGFTFIANGQPQSALLTSNHQSTSYDRKRAQVARFPVGSHHLIRYNPAHPSDIRMQPGYNPHFFAVPLFVSGFGLILAIVGSAFWLAGKLIGSRARRAGAEAATHHG